MADQCTDYESILLAWCQRNFSKLKTSNKIIDAFKSINVNIDKVNSIEKN